MSYKGAEGIQGRPDDTTPRGRVMIERDELEQRLDKLNAFINDKERFDKLNEWQRMAMVNQSMAMCVYLNMLILRLDHWDDKRFPCGCTGLSCDRIIVDEVIPTDREVQDE